MKFAFFTPILLLASESGAWNHVSGTELLKRNGNEQTLIALAQALEQEWTAVQKTEGDKVVSVDCSAESKLCHESGVSSFPAIRLQQPSGKQIRYRGPRKAAAVQGFLHRTSRPTVSFVTPKNSSIFQSIDDVVFIGHFGTHDSHLQRQFETIAEKYRDRYSFATTSGTVRQGAPPTVECFNNPDSTKRSTSDFPTPSSLESFIKRCSTPTIPQMTRRNELSFYQTRQSIVHYFVRSDAEREAYVAEMRPLAKKYAEYLHFVTTDADEYADAAEMMGIKRGSSGGLSVQNPNNGDVFPYMRREKISAGVVEVFLGDIIQGKVKPWRPGGGHDEL
ncbi:hypothetical protein C8A01DRAFT_50768 [Parachaetomium inaequale]|uniref:protein disulfide-isomerase n=1 Tax=Parachaetomium inaequale TaxID=2588326 RepID=A0AAN6P616_9PEZI|nr:hypothetical protein C8A01DRAFT_50768 [Parachaetomium inaequale]